MSRPTDDAEEVYRVAAARTRDKAERSALLAESARVGARAAQYLKLGREDLLFSMAQEAPVSVSREVMGGIYDRVLVRGGERHLYDRIRNSAFLKICPFCGHREVKTLDHYLPQTHFPELCVFPSNLVPSCSDCNKIKRALLGRSADKQVFHPYFNNWEGEFELTATVELGDRVDVRFSVGGDSSVARRARYHLAALELDQFYERCAAVELVQRKAVFQVAGGFGVAALRSELRIERDSAWKSNPHAWKGALYDALAASTDFCSGGFELIEEQ